MERLRILRKPMMSIPNPPRDHPIRAGLGHQLRHYCKFRGGAGFQKLHRCSSTAHACPLKYP